MADLDIMEELDRWEREAPKPPAPPPQQQHDAKRQSVPKPPVPGHDGDEEHPFVEESIAEAATRLMDFHNFRCARSSVAAPSANVDVGRATLARCTARERAIEGLSDACFIDVCIPFTLLHPNTVETFGLHDRCIVVAFRCDKYMRGVAPPAIKVGTAASPSDSLEPFGYAFTIHSQLSLVLKTQWPTLCALHQARVATIDGARPALQYCFVEALRSCAAMDINTVSGGGLWALTQTTSGRCDEVMERVLSGAAPAADFVHDAKGLLMTLVVDTTLEVLDTSGSRCMMCSRPLDVPMPRPSCCSAEVCVFQRQELGLGMDIVAEMAVDPMVADFLLSTGFCRVGTMVKDVKGEDTTHDQECPVQLKPMVLSKCPSVRAMSESGADLRSLLDTIDPQLHAAVTWCIGSNRSLLSYSDGLPEPISLIRSKGFTIHINCATPSQEAKFREHTRVHGSFNAYHGTMFSRLHSIVEHGMRNLSFRTLYGPGIYLTADLKVAFTYAMQRGSVAHPFKNCALKPGSMCVIMCQIAASQHATECDGSVHHPGCSHSVASPHWRVEDESRLMLKAIYVLE